MRKAIPNCNNTIKEEITKLIATSIKFGLNDKPMGVQFIPSFGVNKIRKCLFHRKFWLPKFENCSCVTVLRFLYCNFHSRGRLRFRNPIFQLRLPEISSKIEASIK